MGLAQPVPAAGPLGKAAAEPDAKERRVGRLIRLDATITDKVERRVKRIVSDAIIDAKVNGQWPVFIFEIRPGRSEHGKALDLARYLCGKQLNGARTVAYLPETISGQAVLVALACDEIIMGPEAEIGNAGEFESSLKPSMRSAYEEIAGARKTVPVSVALKMLDPQLELLEVETDVSRELVLKDELDKLKQKKSVESVKVVSPAGKPGVFTAGQMRDWKFVSYLAPDRLGVAKGLGLPASAVDEDFTLDGSLRPVRVAVKGPITAALTDQVQTIIQNQIRDADVNFICLWIDSPGGSPTDSINLANFLVGLDSSQRRTVAYIPSQALADAAYIALACDQIVMHPEAILGGSGAFELPVDQIPATASSVAEIAKTKHHSPALAEAMVNPRLTVFRYTRQADAYVDYFTEDQAAKLDDADGWQRGEQVTQSGKVLRLKGGEAEQIGLTHAVVRDFAEFKAEYGLENDPALVEPGWADFLIDALNSPGVSMFLLLLGAAALYAELQSPGIGLGGLIAAICFLLYFWSAHLGGTAGWLEVILFLSGIGCLVLEIFVLPGFGVFGLVGGLLVIVSLVLASQTFILPRNDYQLAQLRNSLLVLTGAGFGTLLAVALIRHYLPHAPMFNRMLLQPPSLEEQSVIAERESLTQLDHLLGTHGVTTTPLMPGGKAQFGEQWVDVLADGEFVDRGRRVEVIEVRGNRVLVRDCELRPNS
ncbi:MAG TPA: NfeD family protein [Pirellulales bacterium]|nr:NfeD family protein [Pirellulales bacterium]